MSQVTSYGNNGGSTNITAIEPDTGSAAVGPIVDIKGQKYKTTQVMETNSVGNTIYIEDRTWHTPYVVDANTTTGERGTFSTIQAAIDQADADGNSTNPLTALIHIRQGTYTEDLVFADDGRYYLYAEKPHRVETVEPPRLNGTTTFSGTYAPRVSFFGLEVANTFTQTGTGVAPNLLFYSCLLFGNINFNTGSIYLFNTIKPTGTITLGLNATLEIYDNSYVQSIVCDSLDAAARAQIYAINSKILNISGSYSNQGRMRFYNCQITNISGAFPADPYQNLLVDCTQLFSAATATPMITATGNFYLSGCSGNVYNSSPTIFNVSSEQGDIIDSKLTAVSYNATIYDYYIGVTNTSAARTITLPNPTNSLLNPFPRNKSYIIKDQSGGAATNNITIATVAGTIDGAATATINTNYESITLKSDGTNYYVVNRMTPSVAPTSFQPTLTGSTSSGDPGYTTRVGMYTKIGKLVNYSFSLIGTWSGSPTGDIQISIPVAAANMAISQSGSLVYCSLVAYFGNFAIAPGASVMNISVLTTGALQQAADGDYTIQGTITYIAA